jgi:hypothetical protein
MAGIAMGCVPIKNTRIPTNGDAAIRVLTLEFSHIELMVQRGEQINRHLWHFSNCNYSAGDCSPPTVPDHGYVSFLRFRKPISIFHPQTQPLLVGLS